MDSSKELTAILKKLYWDEELTIAQISKKINIPPKTIHSFMKQERIATRYRKHRKGYEIKRRDKNLLNKYGVQNG